MAISVRPPGSPPGGNHLASARIALPSTAGGPAERIKAVRSSVADIVAGPTLGALNRLTIPLAYLPARVAAAGARLLLRGTDVLASNFAGMPDQVHLAGAKVLSIHPFIPLLRTAVAVVMVSYWDRVCLGVTLDRAAIPDPDHFMSCVRTGFDDMLRLADPDADQDRTTPRAR
ncbi:WS/DGAT domain-containing protein [Actinokineospora sp. 24-640]